MPSATKSHKSNRKTTTSLTDAIAGHLRPEALGEEVRGKIERHARAEFPREACGLIVSKAGELTAARSPNRSADPEHAFRTCPKAWRKAEDSGGEVVAVYHSHTNEPPTPSPGDKAGAETKKLPFIIFALPAAVWDYYEPTGWKPPLVGRPFVHGVLDCFSAVRDCLAEEKGIEIPDFEREDEWWKKGKNLYLDNFKEAGFIEVQDLKPYDVLLIQMPRSPVINHSAVYLGDGMMFHHVQGRVSRREPYVAGHGYAREGMLRKIIRHKSLLQGA